MRVLGQAYVYAATATDTPATVAAALAAMVPGSNAVGSVLTVPYDAKLKARTCGFATIRRELRRQVQGIRLTIWAPDRASRDAIGKAVDLAISQTNFLQLYDGPCRLIYVAADVDDVPVKASIWKRDFRITVEYPSTETQIAPSHAVGHHPADH